MEYDTNILNQIEAQNKVAESKLQNKRLTLKITLKLTVFMLISTILSLITILKGVADIFIYIEMYIFGSFTIMGALFSIKKYYLIKNFKEIQLFLEKQEEIERMESENQNIFKDVKDKTKIQNTPQEVTRVFDFNNLNNYSLKDLKKIIRNIEEEKMKELLNTHDSNKKEREVVKSLGTINKKNNE